MDGHGVKAAYIAYQIWLARNVEVFEAKWQLIKVVVEMALALAMEIAEALPPDPVTRNRDTWDPSFSYCQEDSIYFLEAPISNILKG